MVYILVAAVAIYFAQRYLIKRLEAKKGRRATAAELQRLCHTLTARRHLNLQYVFRFCEPLDTKKHEMGKNFADLNTQVFSEGDTACIFAAHKIWRQLGQGEEATSREVCNIFLDNIARQLRELETSEEFRKLPAKFKCNPTGPSLDTYVVRSKDNMLPRLQDIEMQAAFIMCFAASKIMGSKFDEAKRNELREDEGIPGAVDALEEFLQRRRNDIQLHKEIVFLDGYGPKHALTGAQKLYLLERIFSGLHHTVANDDPDEVKQQRYDRLTPAQLGPNFLTTAYMTKCLFEWRGLPIASHPFDMMHLFTRRIRADRLAAAKTIDLDHFQRVVSHPIFFTETDIKKSPEVIAELPPLTDEELLVLSGLMSASVQYKFDGKQSERDQMLIQFAKAKGLDEELETQLELATRESKLSPEERAAIQAEKMEVRLAVEPISAILRPQVPIRFNETPRSWLGGLPQMPSSIDWPRGGAGSFPMHFAAQICCADLPAELWQGKGPRQGWLLLFLDGYRMGNYDGYDGDYPDGWAKVLHIEELGPEMSPPSDIRGVHDPYYAGANYDDAIDETDIPTVWRKWPIDIVPQKIELEPGKVVSFISRSFALRSTTGKELYGIDDGGVSARLAPEDCPPLTWSGALRFVKCAIKQQKKHAAATYLDRTAELRTCSGWVTRLVTKLEKDLESKAAARSQNRVVLKKTLAFLSEHTDEDAERALSAHIADETSRTADWWAAQSPMLEALLIEIKAKDQDAPLSKKEWSDLDMRVANIRREILQIGVSEDGDLGRARLTDLNIVDHAWPASVVREHYLDLYAKSAETQALIPEQTKETIAKIVREVKWGRPHRIGGLADPLQSDIGPDDPPLLFQIASDDTLNWMWGDAGAIFIHTTDQELSERKFKVFANMECH